MNLIGQNPNPDNGRDTIMIKTVKLTTIIALMFAFTAWVFAGEIHDAVTQGEFGTVKKLLASNPELIAAQDEAGSTPLHVAVQNGHKKIAKYLLKKGAEIEAGDNEHTTPLQTASLSGHKDLVEYLLKQGAGLHRQDDNGFTALHWAAYRGHLEVADYLIKQGADANAQKSGGSTPMHGAAYYGHPEMVRLLIARGADFEAVNDAGFTPLLSGAAAGQIETVQILLEKGADIAAKNEWNGDAMYFAVDSGNIDLVKLLLENGVKVKSDDPDWRNPLEAAAYEEEIEIAELLIEHGSDVNSADENGRRPLHAAAHRGNAEFAELLLKNGADPDVKDQTGRTPLYVAVLNGYHNFAAALIANGANLETTEGIYQQTPLHRAVIQGYGDIAEMLCQHGANLNAIEHQGRTPLYFAGKYGHQGIADHLKKRGAVSEVEEENFGRSLLLEKSLRRGEAILWYLGHTGWAIKTQNHLMVFDYWKRWASADEPCLANGHISSHEIADQNLAVYVTHEHGDHFDTTIFDWQDKVKNIKYIYGFQAENLPQYREAAYNGPGYEYIAPRQYQEVDGMKIWTIDSNDAGVGFLVQVDGISIWHAGDHAGWDDEDTKAEFIREIDYLDGLVGEVDFAFVNVTGCRHSGHPEELFEGNAYTIDKLNARVTIPTHGVHNEHKYKEFAERMASENYNTEIYAPENCGDNFFYHNGSIISLKN